MAELCTCGFQFRRTQVTAQPARNAAVFTTAVTVRRANKSLQAVVGCAPFFSLLILALLAPLTTCLELRGHGSAVGTKGVDVSRGPAVVGCPQRSSLSEKKAVNGRGVVLLCCAGCVRSLNLPPGRGTVRAALAFRTKTPTKTMETLAPEIRFHAVVAACYVPGTRYGYYLSWPALLLFLLRFSISLPLMRSRFAGVLFSGYGVRSSSAFAFSLATAGSGAIRHTTTTFTAEAAATSAPCRGDTATPGPLRLHNDPARSSCFHVHHRRSSSPFLMSSVASTTDVGMGQDAGEMFDVFLAPKSLSAQTEPPVPAGFAKARGLVHADGDWHRSVHIWLHNSKVSFGALCRFRLPGIVARRCEVQLSRS